MALKPAPSLPQRRTIMRRAARAVARGETSYEQLCMEAAAAIEDPIYEPIHVNQAFSNPSEVIRMLDRSINGPENMLRRDIADTTTGAFYVRPEVEAALYVGYLNKFPLIPFLPKQEAIGQFHPYRTLTSAGSATFVAEFDQIGKDHAVGAELVARMVCAATQRGATMWEQFNALQGGGPVGGRAPVQAEADAGAEAIGAAFQTALIYGTRLIGHTVPGDVFGVTMTNAFEGLRVLGNNPGGQTVSANGAAAPLLDGMSSLKVMEVKAAGASGLSATVFNNLYTAIRAGSIAVAAAGGNPDLVLFGPYEAARTDDDAPNKTVFINNANGDFTAGYGATRIRAGNHLLDLLEMPGGLPAYPVASVTTAGDTTALTGNAAEVYVMDRRAITWGWVGQETPMMFDNSFADDRITQRRIIAGFGGPIYHHPNWIQVIRVQQ